MSGFIAWLEDQNEKDSKVRAVLRRSLSFEPGMFPPAYPYVEPFIKDEDSSWKRRMFYLVAGLWAEHWRDWGRGSPMSIGKVCAGIDNIKRKTMSKEDRARMTGIEKRFVYLLDADSDQLPHRLRQMISLLKDEPVDFGDLLTRLLYWNDDQKRTQNAWARDFYRSINRAMETEFVNQEEDNENSN